VLEVFENVILGEFEMHREQFGLKEDTVISGSLMPSGYLCLALWYNLSTAVSFIF
jgi:hypothetical protein